MLQKKHSGAIERTLPDSKCSTYKAGRGEHLGAERNVNLFGFDTRRLGRLFSRAKGASFIGYSSLILGDVEFSPSCGKEEHQGTWVGFNVMLDGNYGKVKIGSCVRVASYAYVSTHSGHLRTTEVGERVVGPVTIEDHCFIGPFALIEANTTIGHHSTVGSHSRVRGVFPPYSFIVGNPATSKTTNHGSTDP